MNIIEAGNWNMWLCKFWSHNNTFYGYIIDTRYCEYENVFWLLVELGFLFSRSISSFMRCHTQKPIKTLRKGVEGKVFCFCTNVIKKYLNCSQMRQLHPYHPAASPTMRTAAPLTSLSAPQHRRNQREMERGRRSLDLQWRACWMSWRAQCLHPGKHCLV